MGTSGVHGDASRAGVLPRLAHDLFARSSSLGGIKVTVSVLEVYGEELRDLLAEGQPNKLLIRQDPRGDIFVSGLAEVAVSDSQSLLNVLDQGMLRARMPRSLRGKHDVFPCECNCLSILPVQIRRFCQLSDL